jgi:hypothetical protein
MGKGRNPTAQIAEFSNNRLTNFSCLASDSESDSEVLESEVETEVESEESESESELEEKPQDKVQEQNQFRVWKSEESRFSTVKNIFSSPFSKKKRRVKEEEWVSILGEQGQQSQSQGFQEQSQGQSQSQSQDKGQDFSSLLNRNDISEEQNALAWAEKVKLTLERAGQNRSELKRTAAKSEDTSNVSFFRRSIVLDENF